MLCDRNAGPALLAEWRPELRPDELPVVLSSVWQMAEVPIGDDLEEDDWIGLWREAGFVSTAGNPPPIAPLVVYRGAPAGDNGYGLSWTTDREKARWFARRWTL